MFRERPIYYKSKVTGRLYSFESHSPRGTGGQGDLPAEEYPYTIIYETIYPNWISWNEGQPKPELLLDLEKEINNCHRC